VAALAAAVLAGGLATSRFLSRSTGGPRLTVTGGGVARPFRLPNVVAGQPDVDLASLRGQPVVVNFWASWCVPCRQEMPALEAVHERVANRVVFVGVDHQDSRQDALQFLRQTRVRYPSGYDPAGSIAPSFGLFGLPSTIFMSPRGEVIERRTGAFTEAQLQATVDRLYPR